MKKFNIIFLFLSILSCSNKNDVGSKMPAFDMELFQTRKIFNTSLIRDGNFTVFMYFQPDCPHCRLETIELIKYKKALKDVNVFLITATPLDSINKFVTDNKLLTCKNVIVAHDYTFIFFKLFRPPYIPFLILYDKAKSLKAEFIGEQGVQELVRELSSDIER